MVVMVVLSVMFIIVKMSIMFMFYLGELPQKIYNLRLILLRRDV